jgi:hypothetical protein
MPSDIFISYARKDDQAAKEVIGSKGMVTALHDRLLASFDSLGAPQPTIFRDVKQIDSAQQFEPRLGEALRGAEVMVVVLSRNWLISEWCRRELDTFMAVWHERNETDQRIRERIFVVRKHAVPPDARPVVMQGQSGIDLVAVDKENNEETEYFDSDLGRPRNALWFEHTEQLAKALRNRVKNIADPLAVSAKMKKVTVPEPSAGNANPITVYVAHPAADMKQSYDTLIEELKRRGIGVVPDSTQTLPMQGDQAVALIDGALAEALVSIHLLGDKAGFQPEDAAPIVRLQLERSAAKVALSMVPETQGPPAFHRLIWAPSVIPGAAEGSVSRNIFDVLAKHSVIPNGGKREDALCQGDKLDGDTLTKFVQFVLQHIEEVARPPSRQSLPVGSGAQVYVQHDENDTAEAEAIAAGLMRLGFSPLLPIIEGDSAGRMQVHRDNLLTADAVVLCWALAAPVWIRAMASELRNWQTLGRDKAFFTRTVVALPPSKADKGRLSKFRPKTDLDGVIDATSIPSLNPDHLDPILQQLVGSAP